jgi:hypothetical protein
VVEEWGAIQGENRPRKYCGVLLKNPSWMQARVDFVSKVNTNKCYIILVE